MPKIKIIDYKGVETSGEVAYLVGQIVDAPVSAYRLTNPDGDYIEIDAEDCEVIS